MHVLNSIVIDDQSGATVNYNGYVLNVCISVVLNWKFVH